MDLKTKPDIDYMSLVHEYHKSMRDYNLNLVYEGEVNQAITKVFTSLAEQSLNEKNEEKKTIKKVYHVMVECLQNIYKHSDEIKYGGNEKKKQGIFLVGQNEKGYIISTGNTIENEKVEGIRKNLDYDE